MTLTGLVLLVLLTFCNALQSWGPECVDCNDNGQWWPLFRPSQIIKSEFPEHRRQFVSDEAYDYSGEHGSRERYRVDWEHYGDVSRVSTGPNGSVESHERDPEPRLPPPRSGERVRAEDGVSAERVRGGVKLRSGETSREEDVRFRQGEPSDDISVKSMEGSLGSYFEHGSFSPSRDRLADDFDGSKDFSFSNEESSNSIEFPSFSDGYGRQNKVATSYAAFSSVFAKPKPISSRARDLPPANSRSYLPNYTQAFSQARTPVSHFKFYNGLNTTGQSLVHAQPTRKEPEFGVRVNHHDPEGLWINHESPNVKTVSRSSQFPPALPLQKQLTPFVPKDHPVYRYVKNNAGLASQPLNRRNQDLHQDFRAENHTPVQIQVQKHESVVRHVIPTKDPFSSGFWKDKDSSWKESRNVETFHPPPLPPPAAHSFLIIKKKRNNLDLRRIGRINPHYVYIVRSNNRIS